jgi:hypothetical protein
MNKYWWSLKGRWSLSAHVELNWQHWGVGVSVRGHGPGVDPGTQLWAGVTLTLGPAYINATAELLTDDQATMMRDMVGE